MADRRIPGAVVVLVKDEQVVLARGYGVRDLASGAPVDPDRTVFHVDSLAKPVTATAILQLVERGQVRLDRDVNVYLTRFQVRSPYPRPVTLAALLTHTAGLDYDLDDVGRDSPSRLALRSWDDRFVHHPPVPVLPPGRQYLYSNAAYSLLGEVVADVSGLSFEQYVAAGIFSPLRMTRSGFAQPSPFAGDLATSYEDVDGLLQAVADDYLADGPARGMTTTATDLAHFMIAMLDEGRYGSARILSASSVQDQQRQHFTFDPILPGATYGFQEWPTNGQRVLGHHGEGPGRHSTLVLLPDQHLGFFLASTCAGDDLFTTVFGQLMDHFYPSSVPIAAPPPAEDVARQSARLAGTYRSTAYSHRTLARLLPVVSDPAEVRETSPGRLTISFPGTAPRAARAVAPLLYRLEDGQTAVAFKANANGDVTTMVYYGLSVYEKVRWYETTTAQGALFGLFFLAFLLAAVGVPRTAGGDGRTPPSVQNTRWDGLRCGLARVVGGLNAAWLIVLFVVLRPREQLDLGHGLPPPLAIAVGLPVATSALGLTFVILAVLTWRRADLARRDRVRDSLVAMVVLAYIPFLSSWNLLGLDR